ncbi:aspartate carbamoyltransferase [Massilia endophytica]|uniref:aspartate carbamoyltransferase n=1 Tax=Massilia endophytica TaxID=2899220 RepID=UPI001E4C5EAA|nr:aspartate carbamoyltransferase [Massilia endophytica]UGQ46056.1 aspartate carbamoyltransferase [Massilia endophytica]
MKLIALLIGALAAHGALAQTREQEVRARGPLVMPFSLHATTHVFTKTPDGGVQKVLVKNLSETNQRDLVQVHLRHIAAAFSAGDFSGPSALHGDGMPGLARLKAAPPGAVSIKYAPLANGAQITYSTKDAALQAALHAWFDAQLSDHGSDATSGHAHHGH